MPYHNLLGGREDSSPAISAYTEGRVCLDLCHGLLPLPACRLPLPPATTLPAAYPPSCTCLPASPAYATPPPYTYRRRRPASLLTAGSGWIHAYCLLQEDLSALLACSHILSPSCTSCLYTIWFCTTGSGTIYILLHYLQEGSCLIQPAYHTYLSSTFSLLP